MRKCFLFLSLIFMASAFDSYAQVINVPQKAKDHFSKKYPQAQHYDWHNSVVAYTCKFKMNEHHYSAHYKLNGKWYFTEKALSKDELPEAVKKAIKISRYADWEDKSVAYVENEKGSKLYRVEMKKGIEEIFVFYDAQGKEKKSNLKL